MFCNDNPLDTRQSRGHTKFVQAEKVMQMNGVHVQAAQPIGQSDTDPVAAEDV
jgi:hypothetical protein